MARLSMSADCPERMSDKDTGRSQGWAKAASARWIAGLIWIAMGLSSGAMSAGLPLSDESAVSSPERRLAEDEARLVRVRTDLLRQLAAAPAHVLALSWIDDRGALRESTQFTSETGLPLQRVLNAAAAPPAGHCRDAPVGLRSPVTLSLTTEASWSARHPSRAQQLHERVKVQIARRLAGSSAAWFAVGSPEDAGSAYWQALTGHVAEDALWRLELALGPQAAGWQLSAVLTALDPAAAAAGFARDWRIPLEGPQQMTATGPEFDAALGALLQAVHERLACSGPRYPVLVESGREPELRVGRETGLQVGDRLLLQDRAVLPRRGLSPGALGRLAIVEVTAVGPRRIGLVPVAGMAPDGQGRWVALPL